MEKSVTDMCINKQEKINKNSQSFEIEADNLTDKYSDLKNKSFNQKLN